jgi:hypothetical protein
MWVLIALHPTPYLEQSNLGYVLRWPNIDLSWPYFNMTLGNNNVQMDAS